MKKISTVFLIFCLFSWGLAQDPGGADSIWVEIDNTVIPPTGGDVTFKIRLYTDNTGNGNDIVAVTVPLYITNSNPSANPVLDTAESSTFSGTRVDSFDIHDTYVPTNGGDPSAFPLQFVLVAVELNAPPDTGITSGTYIFAFVTINLSDTTTICLDTMSTETVALELITSNVVSYTPHWKKLCSPITTTGCTPGDFAGGGSINLTDMVFLFNYIFKCGPSPTCLPNEANGNCELDLGDVAYLVNRLFKTGPAPVSWCSNPDTYSDPGNPDTVRIGTVTGCPGDTVLVPVYINNDELISMVIPLRIDTTQVVCDSIIKAGPRGGISGIAKYCADQTGILLFSNVVGANLDTLGSGSGLVAYLKCRIKPGASGFIAIDTSSLDLNQLRLFKSNTYSIKPGFKSGGINVTCPTNFKVTLRAFSPVNLVVIEPTPEADSLGLDTTSTRPDTIFNTILQGSTYDTTQDANNDNENDVIITIPVPYNGPYQIRVVPTDTGQFSLDYQAGNNLRVLLADSVVIVTTDTNFTYGLVVLPYLRGDANSNGARGLVDIIYLKNFVFGVPQGPPPDPMELGNVNCDLKPNGSQKVDIVDIVYMVNFVFYSGPPPCS